MRHNLQPKIIAHGSEHVLDDSDASFGGWVDNGDGKGELIEAFVYPTSSGEECFVEFRGLPRHLEDLALCVGHDTYASSFTPEQQDERAIATQLAILRYAVGACQSLPEHITPHYDDECADPRSRHYAPYR